MRISFILNHFATTVEYLEIEGIEHLPHTHKEKLESPLWHPSILRGRRQEQNPETLTFEYVVFDIDELELPDSLGYSDYAYYYHHTHSGKLRVIYKLANSITVTHEQYAEFYKNFAEYVGLVSYDEKCSKSTQFFYLPRTQAEIFYRNGCLPEFKWESKSAGLISSTTKSTYYPAVDPHLLERFRRLSSIYGMDAKFRELKKRHQECWFHESHSGALDLNTNPANIYCHHTNCYENILKELYHVTSLTKANNLTRTEAYLLYGLYKRLWDWNFIERLYLPEDLKEKQALLYKLNNRPEQDVKHLVDILYDQFIVYEKINDLIYKYNGRYYEPVSLDRVADPILTKITQWFRYKEYKGANKMVDHKAHLFAYIRERGMALIRKKNGLTLRNGILSFDKMTGEPQFDKNDGGIFITEGKDFDYNPTIIDCPLWMKCLSEWFGDKVGNVLLLQEWFGLCLTDWRHYEKYMVLFGEKRGGKNTIADLISYITVGAKSNFKSIGNVDRRGQLWNKKVLFIDEQFDTKNESVTGLIKELVSPSPVACRLLFKEEFNSETFPKIMISFNDPPKDFEMDQALNARTLAIYFDRTFLNKENVHLGDQLKAEATAILNWAIVGLKRVVATSKFNIQYDSKLLLAELTLSEVEAQVKEYLDGLLPGKYIPTELYRGYLKTLPINAEAPVTINKFSRCVGKYFRREKVNGVRYWVKDA